MPAARRAAAIGPSTRAGSASNDSTSIPPGHVRQDPTREIGDRGVETYLPDVGREPRRQRTGGGVPQIHPEAERASPPRLERDVVQGQFTSRSYRRQRENGACTVQPAGTLRDEATPMDPAGTRCSVPMATVARRAAKETTMSRSFARRASGMIAILYHDQGGPVQVQGQQSRVVGPDDSSVLKSHARQPPDPQPRATHASPPRSAW